MFLQFRYPLEGFLFQLAVCACLFCVGRSPLVQVTRFPLWLSLAPRRLRIGCFSSGLASADLDFLIGCPFGVVFHRGEDLDDFVRFEEGG